MLREWIRRTEKMDLTSTSVTKSPWIALSQISGTQSECDISQILRSKDVVPGSCWELIKEAGTWSPADGDSLLLHRHLCKGSWCWGVRDNTVSSEEPASFLFSGSWNYEASAFPLSLWAEGKFRPQCRGQVVMKFLTFILFIFCVMFLFLFKKIFLVFLSLL